MSLQTVFNMIWSVHINDIKAALINSAVKLSKIQQKLLSYKTEKQREANKILHIYIFYLYRCSMAVARPLWRLPMKRWLAVSLHTMRPCRHTTHIMTMVTTLLLQQNVKVMDFLLDLAYFSNLVKSFSHFYWTNSYESLYTHKVLMTIRHESKIKLENNIYLFILLYLYSCIIKVMAPCRRATVRAPLFMAITLLLMATTTHLPHLLPRGTNRSKHAFV